MPPGLSQNEFLEAVLVDGLCDDAVDAFNTTLAVQKLVDSIGVPSGRSKMNFPMSEGLQKSPLMASEVQTYVFCFVYDQ